MADPLKVLYHKQVWICLAALWYTVIEDRKMHDICSIIDHSNHVFCVILRPAILFEQMYVKSAS